MVEFLEDGEGVLPRLPGCAVIVKGGVGVAEVDQRFRLAIAFAEVAKEVDCLLVAGEGLLVAAEVVVGVTKAVQRGGLTNEVGLLTMHTKGSATVRKGALMVAQQGVIPADGVGRPGLADPVLGGLVEFDGATGLRERLGDFSP